MKTSTKTLCRIFLSCCVSLILSGCASSSGVTHSKPNKMDWSDPKQVKEYAKQYQKSMEGTTIAGIKSGTSFDNVGFYDDDNLKIIAKRLNLTPGLGFDTSRLEQEYSTMYYTPLGSYLLPMPGEEIQFQAHGRLWKFRSLVDFDAPHTLQYGEGLLRVKGGGFEIGRGILAYEKEGGGWKIYTDCKRGRWFQNDLTT